MKAEQDGQYVQETIKKYGGLWFIASGFVLKVLTKVFNPFRLTMTR